MSKSTILSIIVVLILAGAGLFVYNSMMLAPMSAPIVAPVYPVSTNPTNPSNPTNPTNPAPANPTPPNPVACTMEAKQCPDGSYVGRTGPKCEFAACPPTSTSSKSGITGTVTLGPTCPVERMPPDPGCAPKPYATSINIMKSGSAQIIKTIESDKNGAFRVDIAPGTYTLQAKGGATLPRCPETSARVESSQYTHIEISCDTGIR